MRAPIDSPTLTFTPGLAGGALVQDARVRRSGKVYDAGTCGLSHAIFGKGNKKAPLDVVAKKLSDLDALVSYVASLK